MIIGVEEGAAGIGTFAVVEEEVEVTTESVDTKVVVEAEAAALEVLVWILAKGGDIVAETAMFEEELEVARSLA